MVGEISRKRKLSPSPPRPLSPSESLEKCIEDQTGVALEITKHLFLNPEFSGKNIVFSPLSIHVILSIIAAGTKGENQDLKLKFLKLKSIEEVNSLAEKVYPLVFADGSQRGGPLLSFVNAVWIQRSLPVKPSFRNVVENVYKAAIKQADFKKKPEKARKKVNSWSEKRTNGLITDILPPHSVDDKTKLILANALYFKGEWNQVFDASKTRIREFKLLNKAGSVEAPFMTRTRGYEYIHEFKKFKVLELSYEQGNDSERQYSMCIFLPNRTNGLPALIDKFCSDSEFIKNHIPSRSVPVGEFQIPKFKILFDFDAMELVESLGFSPPGLTEMVVPVDPGTEELEASGIFHKAFIQVNEKGTEAAAVTSGGCQAVAARDTPPPIDFVADHPFLYLIREEVTKAVMFVGQVLNPMQE